MKGGKGVGLGGSDGGRLFFYLLFFKDVTW